MIRGVVLLAASFVAFGQDSRPRTFEVAEVKVNKTGGGLSVSMVNGQIRLINGTMRLMIAGAYSVNPDAVTGGPGWLDSDHFDLIAKSVPDATDQELRDMLRALLVERFKLAAHVDEKVTATYALIVGKGGLKLKESSQGKATETPCHRVDGPPELLHVLCERMTMADLAKNLPNMAPRYVTMPVVDKTGLKGWWDFQLDWTPAGAPGGRGADDAPTVETAGGYTVFDAVAKLGLKLERAKLPVPIVVVDAVERMPVEN